MSGSLPPIPTGSGGKVVTAFMAGVVLGALAVAQVVPAGVAGTPLSLDSLGGVVTDDGIALDDATFSEDGELLASTGFESSTGPIGAGAPGSTGSGTTGSTGTSSTGAGSGGSGASGGTGTGGSATSGTGGSSTGSTTGSTTGADPGGSTGDASGSSSGVGGGGTTIGGGSTGSGTGTGTTTGGPAGCNSTSNGGATDLGVTATEIHVAATVVDDGDGASLLRPATDGMRAALNKVNGAGGICGRRIVLETRNDGWDAATGREYIRRFIEQKKFALLVVPSSEGLASAIEGGLISQAKIPVVGTTGLRISEYSDPWVFPVATATVSYMRAMAKYAHQTGARNFAIVWDNKFRFGVEGATAYKDYLKTLPGVTIKSDIPLNPDSPNYNNEAQKFNTECQNTQTSSGCDVVALLLVPDVAILWKNANSGTFAGRGKRTFGAQTLFTDDFANRCGTWCNGLVTWTGYNPPLPPRDDLAGVRTYEQDVRAVRPSIDTRNQFVEGAYLGTQVFIEAVKQCSPDLTRVCIKQTLESIQYKSDISNALSWSASQRHANRFAQAFSIEATGGGFNGWRYEQTNWVADPGL